MEGNVITEAVEVCPYCMSENVFSNWDVEKQGFIAICWQCGREIMLCDECLHAEDNRKRRCDWHGIYVKGKEKEGQCWRKPAKKIRQPVSHM